MTTRSKVNQTVLPVPPASTPQPLERPSTRRSPRPLSASRSNACRTGHSGDWSATSTRTAPLPQVTCTPTGPVPWRTAFVTSSLVSRRTTQESRPAGRPTSGRSAREPGRPTRASASSTQSARCRSMHPTLDSPATPYPRRGRPTLVAETPWTRGVCDTRQDARSRCLVPRFVEDAFERPHPLFTWAVHTDVVPRRVCRWKRWSPCSTSRRAVHPLGPGPVRPRSSGSATSTSWDPRSPVCGLVHGGEAA